MWGETTGSPLFTHGNEIMIFQKKIPAWTENWKEFHIAGLEMLMFSDLINPTHFLPPFPTQVQPGEIFREGKGEMDWTKWLVGRLLIGIGCEILLKGLFLKHNYSIKNHKDIGVYLLGSEDDKKSNPNFSISFSKLLCEENLIKISANPGNYRPLKWVKDWRNEIGHIPVNATADSGIEYAAIGLSILGLHKNLFDERDKSHFESVKKILQSIQ